MLKLDVEIGDRVKFSGERISYLVRARTNRFLICTKPFAAKKTFFYSIVDLKEKVRGKDNYIGNKYSYDDAEDLVKAIRDLELGHLEVSYRNRIPIKIDKIIPCKVRALLASVLINNKS